MILEKGWDNKKDWNNIDMNWIHKFVVNTINSGESLKTLYHYTSLDSLVNILKTNTLWATNCEYMNDLQELKDIEKTYEYLLETEDGINKKYIGLFKQSMLEKFHEGRRKQTYITSFTKNNDSIAMWKIYGKNGIVLEFDISAMREIAGRNKIIIVDRNGISRKIGTGNVFSEVTYDDSEIVKLVRASLSQLYRMHEQGIKNKVMEIYIHGILTDTFMKMFYLKKDANFSYEQEYRIAFTLHDNDVGKVENFRVKDGLIIPYIIVDFKNKNMIPLKSITINPEQKDYMFEFSIKHLLKSYNFDIPINYSRSRIR
jgi:hypothetical protein